MRNLILCTSSAVVWLCVQPVAWGQSRDDLFWKNQALHARTAALEIADDGHDHGHEHTDDASPPADYGDQGHADVHASGHGHAGHAQGDGCQNRCHAHCDGHGHGHQGHDHGHHEIEFDHCEPFHHRHETCDGYHLMHMFKTEHAWLEREVVLDLGFAEGADGGTLDETELEFEFEYALTQRLMFILGQPIVWLDPDVGSGAEGFGDLETGLQFLAFDGEFTIWSFGLNVIVPTGDEEEDLGSGFTTLVPRTLFWHDFGAGTMLHGEVALDVPVDVDDPENLLTYNFALSHTLACTRCCEHFSHLTPLVEVNSETVVNGPAFGETVVNLLTGVRWIVGEDHQAGFGYSFPVSGNEDFESQWLFSFIYHLGD